jgi:hypothetical protein
MKNWSTTKRKVVGVTVRLCTVNGPRTVSPAVTVSICCSFNGFAAKAEDDIIANTRPDNTSFFIADPLRWYGSSREIPPISHHSRYGLGSLKKILLVW